MIPELIFGHEQNENISGEWLPGWGDLLFKYHLKFVFYMQLIFYCVYSLGKCNWRKVRSSVRIGFQTGSFGSTSNHIRQNLQYRWITYSLCHFTKRWRHFIFGWTKTQSGSIIVPLHYSVFFLQSAFICIVVAKSVLPEIPESAEKWM